MMLMCLISWLLHVTIIEITDCIESMLISNELSFIHINARSVVNKLVYIELLLKSITNDFYILAVYETCGNDLDLTSLIFLAKPKCHTWDLSVTALFIKKIKYAKVNVDNVTFESVFIKLYNVNHNSKTIIRAIYRPQNTDLAPFNLEFEKNY